MNDLRTYESFRDELAKIAAAGGKNIGQLLSSLAERSGVRPSMLPSITQVKNISARGDRGRAAEIAQNVRGYLKSIPRAQQAA